MGQQAKLKARRRALRQDERRKIAAERERINNDPDAQAEIAKKFDDEVEKLAAAHLPAQKARLLAAGWYQREGSADGAGIWDHRKRGLRLLHSVAREDDGLIWGHVSLSRRDDNLPGWYELKDAQWLLYPENRGLVVIAPETEHFSIAEIMHTWTCLTGEPVPDFRTYGQV